MNVKSKPRTPLQRRVYRRALVIDRIDRKGDDLRYPGVFDDLRMQGQSFAQEYREYILTVFELEDPLLEMCVY